MRAAVLVTPETLEIQVSLAVAAVAALAAAGRLEYGLVLIIRTLLLMVQAVGVVLVVTATLVIPAIPVVTEIQPQR